MTQPPPESVPRNPAAPLLIVLSAPSGGGKTTLCEHLLARHPEMTRAITCTTRAPRPGERDGADYYFLDSAAFAQRLAEGGFLEHAGVYGHCYGTPKSEVLERLRQGRDVLLTVDVQGARTIGSASAQDPELRRSVVELGDDEVGLGAGESGQDVVGSVGAESLRDKEEQQPGSPSRTS